MKRVKRNKRSRSGLSDSVKAGGSQMVHGVVAPPAGQPAVGAGTGGGLVGAGSSEVVLGAARGHEGNGRKWRDLDTDILVRVLSYLPQKNLFEAMLVNRNWDESVRDGGTALWRKVKVAKKWEMGVTEEGKEANQLIRRVLQAAQKVRFSEGLGRVKEHLLWSGGVCGHHLKHVHFCGECIDPAFLSTFLTLCPELRSLVILEGEIRGRNPIHICHTKLELVELLCGKNRDLTVHCPSLTHLSTDGRDRERAPLSFGRETIVPSLHCPRLTFLCLSRLHSSLEAFELVAPHAPDLKFLEAPYYPNRHSMEWPPFGSLRTLKLQTRTVLSPQAISQSPHLELLELSGICVARNPLRVCHPRLVTLSISDFVMCSARGLACPSLKKLTLSGEFGKQLIENLNTSCPELRQLSIRQRASREEESEGSEEEVEGAHMELLHETLEDVNVCGLPYVSMRFLCPLLTKLELRWESRGYKRLPRMQGEFPNVTSLEISGYKDVPELHSISRLFPRLGLHKHLYRSHIFVPLNS